VFDATTGHASAGASNVLWAKCGDATCVRTGFTDIEVYGTDWTTVDGAADVVSVGDNYQVWKVQNH
jgi:hypothetical protein